MILESAQEELEALLTDGECQDMSSKELAEYLCMIAPDLVTLLTPLLGELDLSNDDIINENED